MWSIRNTIRGSIYKWLWNSYESSVIPGFHMEYLKMPLSLLEQSCGHEAEKLVCLGLRYFLGIFAQRDAGKSYEFFRMAADRGNITAKLFCGDFYLLGIGTDRNIEKAFLEYKDIRLKSWYAMYNYGLCRELGLGTDRNYEDAATCYRYVIQWVPMAGYRYACLNYYHYQELGIPKEQGRAAALEYFQMAVKAGDAMSYRMLDLMEQEKGNFDKALYYSKRAGELLPGYTGFYGQLHGCDVSFGYGVNDTVEQLEYCLEKSGKNDFLQVLVYAKYVPDDRDRADKLLPVLAEGGFTDALFLYAEQISNKDITMQPQAEALYLRAAEAGHMEAYRRYLSFLENKSNADSRIVHFFRRELERGSPELQFEKAWKLFYGLPYQEQYAKWSYEIFSQLNGYKEDYTAMQLAYIRLTGRGAVKSETAAMEALGQPVCRRKITVALWYYLYLRKADQKEYELNTNSSNGNEDRAEAVKDINEAQKALTGILRQFLKKRLTDSGKVKTEAFAAIGSYLGERVSAAVDCGSENLMEQSIYNNIFNYAEERLLPVYAYYCYRKNIFRGEEALKYFEQIKVKNNEVIWTMARIYYQSRDYKKARRYISRTGIKDSLKKLLILYLMNIEKNGVIFDLKTKFITDIFLKGNTILDFVHRFGNPVSELTLKEAEDFCAGDKYTTDNVNTFLCVMKIFKCDDIAELLYQFGQKVESGRGVKKNWLFAVSLYYSSYIRGYDAAGLKMTDYYFSEDLRVRNWDNGIDICVGLAKKDNAAACHKLGSILLNDSAFDTDEKAADFARRCLIRAELLQEWEKEAVYETE